MESGCLYQEKAGVEEWNKQAILQDHVSLCL